MKNTDGQQKKDRVLGNEKTVDHKDLNEDLNKDLYKDLNKDLKNEKTERVEGSVTENVKGEEKMEQIDKSRHKGKKKNKRSTKEKKSPSCVDAKDEQVKSEENIQTTKKENEKIEQETTFLGILRPVVSLISPFLKNFGNIISVILNFMGAFLLSAYTENDFTSFYERKYGTFHVNFFKGSFKKAVLESKRSCKLLVIYCHMETERNHFCEHIFKDTKVKDFMDANFIVYADSVTGAKVPIIKLMKTKISFPALLVVIPVEESNVKVLKCMNAHPSVSQVIDMLSGCIEHVYILEEMLAREHIVGGPFHNGNVNLIGHGEYLQYFSNINPDSSISNILRDRNISSSNFPANPELERVGQIAHSNDSRSGLVKRNIGSTGIHVRTNRNSRMAFQGEDPERNITDRLIREEQDREYQEALLMDQMKEEKKREQQRLKRLKSDVKKNIKEERREKSIDFNLKINEGEQTTKICSRFPNGKRIQRNFSVEHTIKNIYEWVEYSEFLEKDITVPYKFELICGHSKMVLEKNEKQIKDFDLIPNAILNVKSLDSSDEE